MKKIRVLMEFIRYAVAVKIDFYRTVITRLTGSTTFKTPDVELTVLTSVVDKLAADYHDAQSGLYEAKAAVRKSEAAADDKFRLIAKYVDRIADGDESIIRKAGFNASRQPEPTKKSLFSVETGNNPGEAILHCRAFPGARSYTWQYCSGVMPAKDADWKFAGTTTQIMFTVSNLESLKTYWFRVSPVTSEGMQPWIGPVMKSIV